MVTIRSSVATSIGRRFEQAAVTLRDLEGSLQGATEWAGPRQEATRAMLGGVDDALRSVRSDLESLGAAQADALDGIDRLTRAAQLASSAVEESPRLARNRLQDTTRLLDANARRLEVLRETGALADELRADPTGAPARLVQRLESVLRRPDEAIADEDIRLLAAVDGLPNELRPPMPLPARPASPLAQQYVHGWSPSSPRSYGQVTAAMDVQRWHLALEARGLAQAPDAAARIAARLGRIRDLPVDELGIEDLRELAVLDHAPANVRPALPRPITQPLADLYRESRAEGRLTGQAKLELRSVQLSEQARRLANQPGASKEAFAAQVDAIVSRPADQVSYDELRQVAIIERLPDELRPRFPAPIRGAERSFAREFATIDRPDRLTSTIGFRDELKNLRIMQEQRQLAAQPFTSPVTMNAEIEQLLARPAAEFDAEDVRRLAVIDGLPDHLRPDLPPRSVYATPPSVLAAQGFDGSKEEVRSALRTVSEWRAMTNESGREQLRERLASGQTVTSRTLQHLGSSESLRSSVGIDDESLLAMAMRSVADDAGERYVRVDLAVARATLDRMEETEPSLQRIHDQVTTLIDEALASGRPYPEYAQIGRASAMAELLVKLRQDARVTAATASPGASATLSW